jgi:long-subunit fatty acid transport protein
VHLNALQSTTFPDSEFGVLFRGQADLDQSQSKFTFNAGVLVTPVSKVSLGAVYKKGENFDFTQNFAVTVSDGVDSVDITRRTQAVPVRIPDVFGGGLAVRPTENWVVSADVVRVAYSDADLGAGSENLYQSNGEGGREALADATEIHVGTEYTFPVGSDWLLAVRAGFYTDPDHDGLAGLNSDQTHVTIGGGVVVKNRVQLDVAGNFADFIKEGLLSVVVRF